MAYDKLELEQKALEVIKKHNLVFIEEIVCFLGIDKSTFYSHKLHESDTVKEAILKSKVDLKIKIRKKFIDLENVAGLIALYKLVSTKEEQEALSMKTVEVKQVESKDYDLTKLTVEELEILEKLKAKMQKQNE